jgi:hypothetical protein
MPEPNPTEEQLRAAEQAAKAGENAEGEDGGQE